MCPVFAHGTRSALTCRCRLVLVLGTSRLGQPRTRGCSPHQVAAKRFDLEKLLLSASVRSGAVESDTDPVTFDMSGERLVPRMV